MADKDSDFRKRLRITFDIEVVEHLTALVSAVVELEQTADLSRQVELRQELFRKAHSLKGAAAAVGLNEVGQSCQSLETTFAALTRGELEPSPELFNNLHQALGRIKRLLQGMENANPAQRSEAMPPA